MGKNGEPRGKMFGDWFSCVGVSWLFIGVSMGFPLVFIFSWVFHWFLFFSCVQLFFTGFSLVFHGFLVLHGFFNGFCFLAWVFQLFFTGFSLVFHWCLVLHGFFNGFSWIFSNGFSWFF